MGCKDAAFCSSHSSQRCSLLTWRTDLNWRSPSYQLQAAGGRHHWALSMTTVHLIFVSVLCWFPGHSVSDADLCLLPETCDSWRRGKWLEKSVLQIQICKLELPVHNIFLEKLISTKNCLHRIIWQKFETRTFIGIKWFYSVFGQQKAPVVAADVLKREWGDGQAAPTVPHICTVGLPPAFLVLDFRLPLPRLGYCPMAVIRESIYLGLTVPED